MEERYGKEGRRCIETVPWRDNSNGVVKIERGWGIRGEDEGEGRVWSVAGDKRQEREKGVK